PNQISIGFALETNDELNHAVSKLQRKNFDMVVLNSMNDAGATFGYDTNKISAIHSQGVKKDFPLKPKKDVAADIVKEVRQLVAEKQLSESVIRVV
ncbi:MAG: hypothetical protein ICV79_17835, partial [Flavisolibacter sp.]|nr:hypothetical protein [Flavisolibacter sp.]